MAYGDIGMPVETLFSSIHSNQLDMNVIYYKTNVYRRQISTVLYSEQLRRMLIRSKRSSTISLEEILLVHSSGLSFQLNCHSILHV